MRIVAILLLLGGSQWLMGQSMDWVEHKKVLKLMGTRFEIGAVAENDTLAWAAIEAGITEIERIEKLISSWDETSQTSAINRNAGIRPVQVDQELYDLIFRALKVAKLTEGAFDISFASMDRIWRFDGSMSQMPNPEEVKKAAAKINWEKVMLNPTERTVFLLDKGMKIGFGGIGKGYAANQAKLLMAKMPGIKGGVVNAAGDLLAWGDRPSEKDWVIKIADPVKSADALGWLQINDGAVVTSGDYERYVEFAGKRYAHIIDPRTGYPTTGIKSVTVVCSYAEVADALATSIFVLGQQKGIQLVNQLKGVECLIVTDDNEILTSKHLQLNYY